MVTMGIITARQFCKNRSIPITMRVVSKKVMITSSIDADTKSVVLEDNTIVYTLRKIRFRSRVFLQSRLPS